MLSLVWLYTDNTNDDDNANDNDTQQTNHDCIGSLACMPNEPKTACKVLRELHEPLRTLISMANASASCVQRSSNAGRISHLLPIQNTCDMQPLNLTLSILLVNQPF